MMFNHVESDSYTFSLDGSNSNTIWFYTFISSKAIKMLLLYSSCGNINGEKLRSNEPTNKSMYLNIHSIRHLYTFKWVLIAFENRKACFRANAAYIQSEQELCEDGERERRVAIISHIIVWYGRFGWWMVYATVSIVDEYFWVFSSNIWLNIGDMSRNTFHICENVRICLNVSGSI